MRERTLNVKSEDLKFSSAISQLGNSSGPLCRSPRPRDLLICTFRTTVTEKQLRQDLDLLLQRVKSLDAAASVLLTRKM